MPYELDSEMRSRLREQYHAMSDGELLDMAARTDDLTDMAQEVLRAEMEARRLESKQAVPLPDPFGTRPSDSVPIPEFGKAIERGRIALTTFHDAIDAGQACDLMDEADIEIEVRDLSQAEGRGSFYGGNPVALQLIVNEGDRDRSVKLLREKMGLFPLEEIAEPDAPEDDGTISTVGQFARRADAEDVARVLSDAKVWNRITANPDGSAATEDAFLVEVREVDLVGAGELVEKALNLPEA